MVGLGFATTIPRLLSGFARLVPGCFRDFLRFVSLFFIFLGSGAEGLGQAELGYGLGKLALVTHFRDLNDAAGAGAAVERAEGDGIAGAGFLPDAAFPFDFGNGDIA